ncbi:MAG: hypothetical protein KGH94_04060 [Candidatus Micrarchaeota archaeon]|nr:hypothetical protein [Candidatus Micrarchaeota archaeon]
MTLAVEKKKGSMAMTRAQLASAFEEVASERYFAYGKLGNRLNLAPLIASETRRIRESTGNELSSVRFANPNSREIAMLILREGKEVAKDILYKRQEAEWAKRTSGIARR